MTAPDAEWRVVVVSPHLDDAVLSLGAAIASWSRRGLQVTVLTVLGCDPDSEAPAGGWDARAGFETEAQAARARRREDSSACAIIGATPVWLPFGSLDYDRHGDDATVLGAIRPIVAGADAVVLPGRPLTHPDHAWLVRLLSDEVASSPRLGYYAEQPYSSRERAAGLRPAAPDWLCARAELAFEPTRVAPREWFAELRAASRYRSQLPLLGLGRRGGIQLVRLLWSDARRGGEAVAWVANG